MNSSADTKGQFSPLAFILNFFPLPICMCSSQHTHTKKNITLGTKWKEYYSNIVKKGNFHNYYEIKLHLCEILSALEQARCVVFFPTSSKIEFLSKKP